MKTRIQLEFLPPSVNNIWRHTRKNGKPQTYRTAEYQTWLNAVGYQVNRQAAGHHWTEPVYVTLAMRRPRVNSDVDNRIKGHLDMLEAHGILANDKLVEGVNAYWSRDLPDGVAVEIVISSAASPLARKAA